MKTTLVLDDGLMRRVKALAAQRGVTLSSVVDAFLRRGLKAEQETAAPASRRRRLPSFDMGEPLVDLDDHEAVDRAIERADRVRR